MNHLICPYCNKPILPGEASLKDTDGDLMHLVCSAQEADDADFNNDFGDN